MGFVSFSSVRGGGHFHSSFVYRSNVVETHTKGVLGFPHQEDLEPIAVFDQMYDSHKRLC